MSTQDIATDEEEFHSSFRIFLNAVEMLASPPEEQCRLMGNYNVAWELKEDVHESDGVRSCLLPPATSFGTPRHDPHGQAVFS